MNHQAYACTYRAAMDAATVELDTLFEEAKRLRNRMEEVDSAINALKPLLGSNTEDQSGSEAYSEPLPMTQQIDAPLALVFA